MMTLQFQINKQSLTRIDDFRPVANSSNYLYAKFEFVDEDWNGLEKLAIFNYGSLNFLIPLKEDNSCIVPSDVIKSSGFNVGLKGLLNGKEQIVIPTSYMFVGVTDSLLLEGTEPTIKYINSNTLNVEKKGDVVEIELGDNDFVKKEELGDIDEVLDILNGGENATLPSGSNKYELKYVATNEDVYSDNDILSEPFPNFYLYDKNGNSVVLEEDGVYLINIIINDINTSNGTTIEHTITDTISINSLKTTDNVLAVSSGGGFINTYALGLLGFSLSSSFIKINNVWGSIWGINAFSLDNPTVNVASKETIKRIEFYKIGELEE